MRSQPVSAIDHALAVRLAVAGPVEPSAGQAAALPVPPHCPLVKPLRIQLMVCGWLQRWFT